MSTSSQITSGGLLDLLRRKPASARSRFQMGLLQEVVQRAKHVQAERQPFLDHLDQGVGVRQAWDEHTWWFLGDVHGDYFALHTLMSHILSTEPNANICFLGDIVDRGSDDAACLGLILLAGLERPGKTIWLAGNHDEAVHLHSSGRFMSTVEPAEFADWLNDSTDYTQEFRAELGREFIDLVKRLPRAVLFPDGLLAVHGGVPLSDRWPSIHSLDDLRSPDNQRDFVWTRVPLGGKKRVLVDRYSSGASFGADDLDGFARHVSAFFPVKRLVRGHDHHKPGFESPPIYKNVPLLTVNTFAFDEAMGLDSGAYREGLVVARQRMANLPDLVTVKWELPSRLPFERQRLVDRLQRGPRDRDSADSVRRWNAQMAIQCRRMGELLARSATGRASTSTHLRGLNGRYWEARSLQFGLRTQEAPAPENGTVQPPLATCRRADRIRLVCVIDTGARDRWMTILKDLPASLVRGTPSTVELELRASPRLLASVDAELISGELYVFDGEHLRCVVRIASGGFEIRGIIQKSGSREELVGLAKRLRDALGLAPYPVLDALRIRNYQFPRWSLAVDDTTSRWYQIHTELIKRLERGLPSDDLAAQAWCRATAELCEYAARLSERVRCEDPNCERATCNYDARLTEHTWRQQAAEWAALSTPEALADRAPLLGKPQTRVATVDGRLRVPPRVVIVQASMLANASWQPWAREFLTRLENALKAHQGLLVSVELRGTAASFQSTLAPDGDAARLEVTVQADRESPIRIELDRINCSVGSTPSRAWNAASPEYMVRDVMRALGLGG